MAYENINHSYDAGIAPGVVEYHERQLLKNVMPNLVWARDMQMRPLPRNNGKRVQFRRMVPFNPSTKPLEEGVTKPGQKLRQTDLWVTIKPYGEHIEFTDELDLYHIDNLHREANQLLSRQARQSLDILARDAKCAGTVVQYAGGRASRANVTASDKLTYAELKKAVRTLENANAPRFPDGYYHAAIDPDTEFDLTADAMWIDVAKYQDKRKVETGELGIMAGVKFFKTTEGKKYEAETYLCYSNSTGAATDVGIQTLTVGSYTANSKELVVTNDLNEYIARQLAGKLVKVGDSSGSVLAYIEYVDVATKTLHLRWGFANTYVHPASGTGNDAVAASTVVPEGAGGDNVDLRATVVYGADFAGGVSLDGVGQNVQIIAKPLGSSGSDDPYNQRGTLAYKIKGVAYTILQDAFGVRIEHSVSA